MYSGIPPPPPRSHKLLEASPTCFYTIFCMQKTEAAQKGTIGGSPRCFLKIIIQNLECTQRPQPSTEARGPPARPRPPSCSSTTDKISFCPPGCKSTSFHCAALSHLSAAALTECFTPSRCSRCLLLARLWKCWRCCCLI